MGFRTVESDERQHPRPKSLARQEVRRYLRDHLGWLPGFPLERTPDGSPGLGWCTVGSETAKAYQIVIDRDFLRRATNALAKLRTRFAEPLTRELPDASRWLQRIETLLELLKRPVHEGTRVPFEAVLERGCFSRRCVQDADRLHRDAPSLERLIRAILFHELSGIPEPQREPWQWLEQHREVLVALTNVVPDQLAEVSPGDDRGSDQNPFGTRAFRIQLLLYFLRHEMSSPGMQMFAALFTQSSTWELPSDKCYVPIAQMVDQVSAILEGNKAQDEVAADEERITVGHQLHQFLSGLLVRKPDERRDWLIWLESVLPENFPAIVETVAEDVRRLEKSLRTLLRDYQRGYLDPPSSTLERRLVQQSMEYQPSPLVRRWIAPLVRLLERQAEASWHPRQRKTWFDFACHVDSLEPRLRSSLLLHWSHALFSMFDASPSRKQSFDRVLQQCSGWFAASPPGPILRAHWQEQVELKKNRHSETEIVAFWVSRRIVGDELKRTFALVDTLTQRGVKHLPTPLLRALHRFAAVISDPEQAADWVSRVAHEDSLASFEAMDLEASLLLAGGDLQLATKLLVKIEEHSLASDQVLPLARAFHSTRLRRRLVEAIEHGRSEWIMKLAAAEKRTRAALATIPAAASTVLDRPEIAAASSQAWMGRYPAVFHDRLKELACYTSDAASITGTLIGSWFPLDEEIRDEIASLTALRETVLDWRKRLSLEKRIANFQQRLATSPQWGAKKIENLRQKLEQRLDHEALESIFRQSREVAKKKVFEALGDQGNWGLEDRWFEEPDFGIIREILELPPHHRALGLRLLKEASAHGLAGFFQEEPNVRFLRRMERLGIRTEAWLGNELEVRQQTEQGVPYRIAFTNDVQDYLLMGHHFGTCLSPGSVNFFATISNAVDVNKRVVYGKTEDQKVIGRCLLALTDQGRVLVYRQYAHEKTSQFEQGVEQFSRELVQAMGTELSSAGKVSMLLAQRWYDEGPQPLAERRDFAARLQGIEARIEQMTAEEVWGALVESFGSETSLRIDALSILQQDTWMQRREVAILLIERLGFDPSIDLANRLRLAVKVDEVGSIDLALRLISDQDPHRLLELLRRSSCNDCEAFHAIGTFQAVYRLLVEHSPSRALRLIRATRDSAVRSDQEETLASRRQVLSMIHRRFGRLRQARVRGGNGG